LRIQAAQVDLRHGGAVPWARAAVTGFGAG
jgi:hypothetical protein